MRYTGYYFKIKTKNPEFQNAYLKYSNLVTPEKNNIKHISKIESSGNNVFIVHGHDEGLKKEVAQLIQSLSLKPVILHEQPNQGRTIIEKLEDHSEVAFALVLLTPDDIGGKRSELNPRARQNVILELGFFIGKLGRKKVCALYSSGVELPNDLDGVLYIKHEKDSDEWKNELVKEIKAAGINVDLNKI